MRSEHHTTEGLLCRPLENGASIVRVQACSYWEGTSKHYAVACRIADADETQHCAATIGKLEIDWTISDSHLAILATRVLLILLNGNVAIVRRGRFATTIPGGCRRSFDRSDFVVLFRAVIVGYSHEFRQRKYYHCNAR
jgi:hypothetical protein